MSETPEPPKEQKFKDKLQELQFEELEKMIVARNDQVGRANAASGDRVTITEQLRENDQSPEIVEARNQLNAWRDKLDALVKPLVDALVEDSKGSVDELEKGIKEADQALKPGLNFYKKMYGDDAAEFFTPLARLKGIQVRSGGSGRRIRGYEIAVTTTDASGNDKTMGFENFSSAAKHIGVDTLDLQQAFFAKAGTEKAEDLPALVEFTIDYPVTAQDGTKSTAQAQVSAEKQAKADDADGDSESDNAPEVEVSDDDLSDAL